MRIKLVLLATGLILTACANNKTDDFLDSQAKKPTAQLLSSSSWEIISGHTFNDTNRKISLDKLSPTNGAKAVISFNPDGSMHISGGCNQLGSHWSLNNDVISVRGIISTKRACETSLMDLDTAVNDLLANQKITAKVLNGVNDSLIKMQNSSNSFFVLRAIDKSSQNNASYSGATFSNDFLSEYKWKLVSALDKDNNVVKSSRLRAIVFDFNPQSLTLNSSCGVTTFTTQLSNDQLKITANDDALSEQCSNDAIVNLLLNQQDFAITGNMLAKRPIITLTGNNHDVIVLKGSKK